MTGARLTPAARGHPLSLIFHRFDPSPPGARCCRRKCRNALMRGGKAETPSPPRKSLLMLTAIMVLPLRCPSSPAALPAAGGWAGGLAGARGPGPCHPCCQASLYSPSHLAISLRQAGTRHPQAPSVEPSSEPLRPAPQAHSGDPPGPPRIPCQDPMPGSHARIPCQDPMPGSHARIP
jgi:hypothetical protein